MLGGVAVHGGLPGPSGLDDRHTSFLSRWVHFERRRAPARQHSEVHVQLPHCCAHSRTTSTSARTGGQPSIMVGHQAAQDKDIDEVAEIERQWFEDTRKDIRKERDASKRLRSFSRIGDLESVLQHLPEGVYAFCAGAHPRLGARSPVRLLPRALHKVIVRFAHEPIDINAADEQRGLSRGGTALHKACEDGHVEVVAALIRNGADINARRGYFGEETVLMAACAARRGTHGVQRPDLDTARLILKSGADVNLRTPLRRAAYCNHVDVVRLSWSFVPRSTGEIGTARPP